MARKKEVVAPTILERLTDECFRYPIADSAKGICNFMKHTDEQESVWGRLCREAAE